MNDEGVYIRTEVKVRISTRAVWGGVLLMIGLGGLVVFGGWA